MQLLTVGTVTPEGEPFMARRKSADPMSLTSLLYPSLLVNGSPSVPHVVK